MRIFSYNFESIFFALIVLKGWGKKKFFLIKKKKINNINDNVNNTKFIDHRTYQSYEGRFKKEASSFISKLNMNQRKFLGVDHVNLNISNVAHLLYFLWLWCCCKRWWFCWMIYERAIDWWLIGCFVNGHPFRVGPSYGISWPSDDVGR